MTNIDYEEILNIIQSELTSFVNQPENYEYYKDYKIVLSSEQQFMKLRDKNPNNIYIVVKYNNASILFGQTVVPISLNTLSEENKLVVAQRLMTDFAEYYNLTRTNNNTIQQIWESPAVTGNFNPIYAGYRSLLRTSGVFVITKNAAYYELFYKYGVDDAGNPLYQKIPTVSTSFSLSNNPDSQPFYNTHDFVKSVVLFGAVTITLSTFLLNDNWIVSKVIDMITGAHTTLDASNGFEPVVEKDANTGKIVQDYSTTVNEEFVIEMRFMDGRTRECHLHLISYQVQEQIGEIPTLLLSLSE